MADIRDIVAFSCDGEKILGVVIEHYTNPLDDFYVVYADYALHKFHSSDEDASVIIDNILIPACDAMLADHMMMRQHLKDVAHFHKEIEAMKEALKSKMEIGNLFEDRDIK